HPHARLPNPPSLFPKQTPPPPCEIFARPPVSAGPPFFLNLTPRVVPPPVFDSDPTVAVPPVSESEPRPAPVPPAVAGVMPVDKFFRLLIVEAPTPLLGESLDG